MWKLCVLTVGLLCLGNIARAGLRPFTLVEDAYPEGKGLFEFENTIEYTHHTKSDPGFHQIAVEHELGFGLAENFDLKIAASYVYEDSREVNGLHFDAFAVEGDYYALNPVTDLVGVSLRATAAVGEHSLAFEQTLILQKDWTKWTVAYNLGIVTEIEGVFDSHRENEVTGTLVNSLGVAYNFTPRLRAGAEISAESSYADWSRYEGTTVYAGPVLNYVVNRNLWITVGVDAQLSNRRDEPDFRFAFIAGFSF